MRRASPERIVRPSGPARTVCLDTRPIPCLAPPGVLDPKRWWDSDTLEWRRPTARWDDATPLDGSDPSRMVFVMHPGAGAFLPRELARLHAFGLELGDDEALAPWGIDAATDGLYAERARPRDVFWLAADNLNALFWGLHDWAHFHNHGPFEQRAWTELQCDVASLVWLWENRARVPIAGQVWERARREVEALSRERFVSEGLTFDARVLSAECVQALAARTAGS